MFITLNVRQLTGRMWMKLEMEHHGFLIERLIVIIIDWSRDLLLLATNLFTVRKVYMWFANMES